MAQNETYVTPEGIEVRLPGFWTKNNNSNESAGVLRTDGGVVTTEKEIDLSLTAAGQVDFNLDRDNDGVKDGFSANGVYIPANATLLSADIITRKPAVGGSSITVGLYEFDGTVVNVNGIGNASAADMDAVGKRIVAAGDGLNLSVGPKPVTIGVTHVGNFTEGLVQIMVTYTLNTQETGGRTT